MTTKGHTAFLPQGVTPFLTMQHDSINSVGSIWCNDITLPATSIPTQGVVTTCQHALQER